MEPKSVDELAKEWALAAAINLWERLPRHNFVGDESPKPVRGQTVVENAFKAGHASRDEEIDWLREELQTFKDSNKAWSEDCMKERAQVALLEEMNKSAVGYMFHACQPNQGDLFSKFDGENTEALEKLAEMRKEK